MQVVALVFGILSVIGLGVGFLPCVGWYNWLNIPFAIVGLIIGALAMNNKEPGANTGMALAGVICCAIAIAAGSVRLLLGGGVL